MGWEKNVEAAASDYKEALGGAAVGAACAGPLGGLVGLVVGEASKTHAEDAEPAFITHPRTSLPIVGGGVTLAGLLIAGPAAAVGAGVIAAGGAYWASLPKEDKHEVLFVKAPVAARELVVGISDKLFQIFEHSWTPRIGLRSDADDDTADALVQFEALRRARAAKAAAALEEDGFALHPLDTSDHRNEWQTLESLLITNPKQLGKGKDVHGGGSYDGLTLAAAWRIEHPSLQAKYEAARQVIVEQMGRLGRQSALENGPHLRGLPTRTASAASSLPLVSAANETLLLHGTSADVLFSVLSNGLSERFSGSKSGTAFGDGVYLAEDVGKTDQYSSIDKQFKPSDYKGLHRRLYGKHHEHPGSVFYVLVCRVALGFPARTVEFGKSARHMDTKKALFPVSFRELTYVPDVTPPTSYHSLIAELGGNIARYREFVLFHGEYCLPEYLIAYHRSSN